MEKFLGKVLVTAVAALIAAHVLKGVTVNNSFDAVLFAVVLALLNSFVRPLFIILTIPITILTLGIFLIIINMILIHWAAGIVKGVVIEGWWATFWFSIVLAIVTALIESLIGKTQKRDE
ncbi:MAG TPA: phage holin family protein, partial [Chitinophagaceae bacterium]|nr:phage holin family protein [Chitinophagaceae bacterium]